MRTDRLIEASFVGSLGGFSLEATLALPAVGFTGLLGPSGSGKTSVLRAIAGLLRLKRSRFVLAGDIWQDDNVFLPPHRRRVGYVFQEPSLFPHLGVVDNLLYGTGGRRPSAPRDAIGFDDVVGLLGLEALLRRSTPNLSGGERQRVAIGRALLAQPRLLLMDEPLSALDQAAKREIIPFLERLHRELSLPVIYVSHDLREIERLADHMVVMENGRVIASNSVSAVQADLTLPLAMDRDATVGLETIVTAYDEDHGMAQLRADGGTFLVPMPPARVGEARRLIVAAGQVSLSVEEPSGTTILNVLPARIVAKSSRDNEIVCSLRLGRDGAGATLLARVTRFSWDRLRLEPGAFVYVQVKSVALA